MLGLYDGEQLRPVGTAAAGGAKEEIETRLRPLLGADPKREPRGAPSRWRPNVVLEWSPVEPKLVVEVRYDKWQKQRFRHGTKLLRFRDDKDPEQCTVAQVEQKPKKGDPTVADLLSR
jgi:ATP-dependent DNA ligase